MPVEGQPWSGGADWQLSSVETAKQSIILKRGQRGFLDAWFAFAAFPNDRVSPLGCIWMQFLFVVLIIRSKIKAAVYSRIDASHLGAGLIAYDLNFRCGFDPDAQSTVHAFTGLSQDGKRAFGGL